MSYEAKLIRSGLSPTEVTSALTSMRAELEEEPSEPLGDKIHVACDANGNPIDFEVAGGETHDAKAAPQIIQKIGHAENFIGDKGMTPSQSESRLALEV